MSVWLFDVSLAGLLIALALGALFNPDLRASVALYIAFGLMLALTWARFGVIDLALAEAAIGAGLTGALLFTALSGGDGEEGGQRYRHLFWRSAWVPGMAMGILLFALGWMALTELDAAPGPLPDHVSASMADSGVSHPVTAVLLNFRAWDTLLELLVVLLAVLGMRQVIGQSRGVAWAPWPALSAWSRLLAPLLVVVGGYVLWRGATAPGGAFQAGALLATGAVVLRFSRLLPPLRWSHWAVRGSVLLGVLLFFVVALSVLAAGYEWLEYPANWAGALIVTIEVAATWSIAVSLALLVVGDGEELSS